MTARTLRRRPGRGGCIAAVALVVLASASPARGGERILRHSAVIGAPIGELWTAFTTADGVKKAWGVGVAEVDFRVGGGYRTAYDPKATLGGPDTIGNTILAYEPERMIAIQATAPAGAPAGVKLFAEKGFTVVSFEAVAPDRTRVTLTGMGFGEGPTWDEAYAFFDKGNAWTLEKMKAAFGGESANENAKRAFAKLRTLAGSTWIHEAKNPDGSVFRARADVRSIGRDAFVEMNGFLGDASGVRPHAHSIFGLDRATGALTMWQFVEGGTIATASYRLEGENRLVADWNLTGADGKSRTSPIDIVIEGPDAWRFRMFPDAASAALKPGAAKPLIDVAYRRVDSVPPGFAEVGAAPAGR